jgi:cell wall assembly regulator SMI1
MDAWTRIETWLAANCPKILQDLAGPATDEQVREAEERLSSKLPADMLEIYRRHNGQGGNGPPLAGDWEFLPLDVLIGQWDAQKELMEDESFATSPAVAQGPVKPVWWNVRWIPVTYDGVGDLQCVDLDPADGGRVGQVVVYWHDREVRECIAGSLTEWLTGLAGDLERGKYAVQNGRLVKR